MFTHEKVLIVRIVVLKSVHEKFYFFIEHFLSSIANFSTNIQIFSLCLILIIDNFARHESIMLELQVCIQLELYMQHEKHG